MVQPQHGALDRLAEEFDDDFGYGMSAAGLLTSDDVRNANVTMKWLRCLQRPLWQEQ